MQKERPRNHELKGTTLRVYLTVLEEDSKRVGAREISRKLRFSSPNMAVYHLEKLRTMKLIEKDEFGTYAAIKEVKVEFFADYIRIFDFVFPRFFFYSVFFTSFLIFYLILFPLRHAPEVAVSLIISISACVIMWVETIKIWLRRSF